MQSNRLMGRDELHALLEGGWKERENVAINSLVNEGKGGGCGCGSGWMGCKPRKGDRLYDLFLGRRQLSPVGSFHDGFPLPTSCSFSSCCKEVDDPSDRNEAFVDAAVGGRWMRPIHHCPFPLIPPDH